MLQVFRGKENIGVLSKTGNTTVQLDNSVLTIGAKQYVSGQITLDTTSSGLNGIDSGSVSASEDYYIYAVVNDSQVHLVASLNSNAPIGYSQYKKIGGFFTKSNTNVDEIGILNNKQLLEKEKYLYQTNILSANVTSTTQEVTDLRFNNLEIGRRYRVKLFMKGNLPNSGSDAVIVNVNNGAQDIMTVGEGGSSAGSMNPSWYSEKEFVASENTLTFIIGGASGGSLIGDGTVDNTYAVLEEIPKLTETTKFN